MNRESTVYIHMHQCCITGPGQTYDYFSASKLFLKDRGKIDSYLKHMNCVKIIGMYYVVLHVFGIKEWRYSDKNGHFDVIQFLTLI